MHEASIAIDLLRLVADQAQLHQVSRVTRVVVKLGQLSSVIPEALYFAWQTAKNQTIAQDATLEIQSIPAKAVCSTHGAVLLNLQRGIRCPICDLPTPEILEGEELELDCLELE
ncbi:MAG: hydrogenase maturation nickel metallochaperone HypA [Deinococcales bacterium]